VGIEGSNPSRVAKSTQAQVAHSRHALGRSAVRAVSDETPEPMDWRSVELPGATAARRRPERDDLVASSEHPCGAINPSAAG
jgi:hypothetical protein